ncbi:transcriptional activator HlyU [Neorhizobium lilium]|uniref:Transcriptional activator HlyU n=1 Tax=Neorhizobium lilium TaxID=2503024 RepID=A0A3S3SZ99_9HYPH|nr:HlyU family transcriptional regulator [Neorhizobium lilium]RWX78243.1 transcriptional activator HlyU [Neorhizobium lilium]
MASFLSNLFSMFSGGDKTAAAPVAKAEPQLYGDCRIFAEPMREGSQFRLAGRIEKDVSGAVLTRTFVRADVFTTHDDAVEFTIRKAQQIIDQNGLSLFSDGEKIRAA